MLIDKNHKRWIAWSAVTGAATLGSYFFFARHDPDGVTGGSAVGLWYGMVGSALMVYAGLLSAHRRLSRWSFLPSRAWLLKGHIWLGLLSLLFIMCHSGFRWGGALEKILWIVFGLTLVTGIIGLALQQVVPRWLGRLPDEVPYEQIPHALMMLRREADRLMEEIAGPETVEPATALQREVRTYYEQEARGYLAAGKGGGIRPLDGRWTLFRDAPDLAPVRPQLERLRDVCTRRHVIAEQEKLHRWLHVWLVVHVPLAAALLVLGTAHAVLAALY